MNALRVGWRCCAFFTSTVAVFSLMSCSEETRAATVHTKIKDKTVFLVEVKQAGIFEIRNIAEEQMSQIMGIACPQIVYPYLRGNVADLIQRSGFPPVHLSEINFQAMYEQQRAQAQADAPQIVTQ